MPLSFFTPLAELAGLKLFSLQKGPGSEQLAGVAECFEIADWGSRFENFQDTAAASRISTWSLPWTRRWPIARAVLAFRCGYCSRAPPIGAGSIAARTAPGILPCASFASLNRALEDRVRASGASALGESLTTWERPLFFLGDLATMGACFVIAGKRQEL